jgi:hypothetical protein
MQVHYTPLLCSLSRIFIKKKKKHLTNFAGADKITMGWYIKTHGKEARA